MNVRRARTFSLLLWATASLIFFPVASSSAQACPNELFRTGYGADLPDCRAYERASPAEKNGGSVEGFPGILTTANDGSSVTFYTQAGTGIPSTGGAPSDFPAYMSIKAGEAWSTQRLMPSATLGQNGSYLGATRDQGFAFFEALRRGTGPEAGRGLYILDTRSETVQTLVPSGSNPVRAQYAIDGASADGSRVLFETEASLTANAAPGDNLYLWSRATGAVTLAGVLPGEAEQAPPSGSFGGAHEWYFEESLYTGGALAGLGVEALNAMTPDASEIYFTAGETGQLYLRRGLAGSSPETVPVSVPNPGVVDPNGERPAAFQEATPDGSMAFFLSSGKLTADANTGSGDEGRDLYRWNSVTRTLTDIAPDATEALGAQVQGLLGVNESGTSGYFVAEGILAAGAQAGAPNLYRFETSPGATAIEFIATLQPGSANTRLPDPLNWSPRAYQSAAVAPEAFLRSSRVSANGGTLIFSSVRSLTGYENRNPAGSECQAAELGRCGELFRYTHPAGTTGAGSLACISCDPNGAAPLGSAHLQSAFTGGTYNLPQGSVEVNFPDNLSASGDQVFFESPDPLLAADTNGGSGCPDYTELRRELPACQDVYEWEAAGTPEGSCAIPEVAGGCLYLLSTGKSDAPSSFAGASADGRVAFIVTNSQLVPEDTDTAADVYAVRTDGGLAAQFRSPPASCAGEDCLGSSIGPPGPAGTGSAEIEGSRNVQQKHRRHKSRKHHKHRAKKKRKPSPGKSKHHGRGARPRSVRKG